MNYVIFGKYAWHIKRLDIILFCLQNWIYRQTLHDDSLLNPPEILTNLTGINMKLLH